MTASSAKKNSVLIIYPVGGYGTFVDWALSYFSGFLEADRLPFVAETGSSHNYSSGLHLDITHLKGLHDTRLLTVDDYLNSELTLPFVRTNAYYHRGGLQNYLDTYAHRFKGVVFLQPSVTDQLLLLNNTIEKVTVSPYGKEMRLALTSEEYEHGPVWQQRNHAAKWFESDAYLNYLRQGAELQHPGIEFLKIRDFVENPQHQIDTVLEKFGTPRSRPIGTIFTIWFKLQKHINKDQLCQRIVDSIVHDQELDWSDQNLTFVDQACIQHQLNKQGLKLDAQGIDTLPTNSLQLKKLLNPL